MTVRKMANTSAAAGKRDMPAGAANLDAANLDSANLDSAR